MIAPDKANDPVCYKALFSSTSDWDLLHCYAERFEDARKLRDSIPQEDTALHQTSIHCTALTKLASHKWQGSDVLFFFSSTFLQKS